MSVQPSRTWVVSPLLLGALALLLTTAATGAPGDAYTALSSPPLVKASSTRAFTVQLTSDPDSSSRAQRAKVGIPGGFSVAEATVTATTTAAGSCAVATWEPDGPLIADGKINLRNPTGEANELCPGATLTVTFDALAPAVDGTGTWTTELLAGDAFLLIGSQPTVTADGTAPETTIATGPSGTVTVRSATFTFSSEPGAGFECSLDGATFGSCTSPTEYSGLGLGAHSFQVRALDGAGNADPTPAARSWAVANPTVSIGDATVTEGDAGTINAVFTATLSSTTDQAVTVDFTTANGSATAGADYASTSGTATFLAGENTRQVTVPVNGDALDELDESFSVNLSNASNATIADGQGVGTITDNDPQPSLAINDVTVSEGDAGTVAATFTVTLGHVSGRVVTVSYASASGTAASPGDYLASSGLLSFAPGQTTRTIDVTINGDLLDEDDETFTIGLSSPTGATVADPSGLGTITDNDPLPALSVNDVTVAEGDSGTVAATFTVSLSAASGRGVAVDFATTNGTAVSPGDYAARTGSVTFSAGETTKQVAVTVNGDMLSEPTESYSLTLGSPQNATIADSQGAGTIIDDDGPPTLSVNDVTVAEGNSGSVDVTFVVTLSAASGQPVAVHWATSNGTATAGADYEAAAGDLAFAPGVMTRTFVVTATSDLLDELDEAFSVQLSDPSNAQIGDGSGLGTITDDDAPPTLSVNSVAVTEGDTGTANATFTVTLSRASGLPITVDYQTANGTATVPADYQSRSGTLSFGVGETSKQVAVPVNGDTLDEAAETFTLNLAGPTNATLADAAGVGTINDNDPLPALSIGDATVTEGNSGSVNAVFTVTLAQASGRPVTVDFSTAAGTAAVPADFTATNGSLTFAAGETTKSVSVPVNGDLLDEVNETFTLNLSNPGSGTIADGSGLGTITDDDAPPALSINDVTVVEGNTGPTSATFTISLNAPSGKAVSVHFGTANGTASAPGDYVETQGTVGFAAGETTETVSVLVNGDFSDESDETFTVNLSSAVNATITDAQGVGTITDNDGMPSISVNDVRVAAEGQSGGIAANFTVSLSAASSQIVKVDYATADGTATAGADYVATSGTLTFAPGTTAQPVAVSVTGDTLDEVDETFTVALSRPVAATIGDGSGLGTITDDDAPPTLSVNSVAVTEGDTGTANATFTVTLSRASGLPITVDYQTANGTATVPADYQSRSGTLSFGVGETSKQVAVPVNGDTLDEAAETFTLNLAGPTNATLADAAGVGTINDNDPLPALSIGDATVTEGNSGSVNAVFTVTLAQASGRPVTVDFSTAAGTAAVPADFTATNGSLTFAAGETTKSVSVPVNGDLLDEVNETFTLNLSNPGSGTIADGSGLGTITDDDAPPALSINDVTVVEGNTGPTSATFTISLNAPSGKAVSVHFETADGTATTANNDYEPSSGTPSFAVGEIMKQLTVRVNGDTLDEVTETYVVNLSSPTNATIADPQGVGTIIDNDGLPTAFVSDVVVGEGNSGLVNASFTVTLSATSGQTVTVTWATADDTATAGEDYEAAGADLVFAPGTTSRTFTVKVKGDLLDELEEAFKVVLSAPSNADIGDAQGLGSIIDDDAPPTISIGDVTVAEGASGLTSATFTVALSRPSGRPIAVSYATADGTAGAPDDYAAGGETLGFEPGQASNAVIVSVHGDTAFESDETFLVNLAGAVNADLLDAKAVGTITNDDAAPEPPAPPAPPAPPPPPPTPPPPLADVANVRVQTGDRTVTVTWGNPAAANLQRVTVTRIRAGRTVQNRAVYEGAGTSFTDRGLKNGVEYRYRIKTHDVTGTASAGVVVRATPKAVLIAPARGAVVSSPPVLRWISSPGATYYNVQIHLVRRGGTAKSGAATKVLSVWPSKPSFKLSGSWRFGGKRYSLVPGRYRWYVWPGLGKRVAKTYGPMLGESTFTMVEKAPLTKKR